MLGKGTRSLAAYALFLVLAAPRGRAQEVGGIEGRVSAPGLRGMPGVVFLEPEPGEAFAPGSAPFVIDQVGERFEPRVSGVLAGTRVSFPNGDRVRHSVFSPDEGSVQPFDLGTYRPGDAREVVLGTLGIVPLRCSIHSEMKGTIVVCPTPYFVTTDDHGAFALSGIPVGDRQISFAHESLGTLTVSVRIEPGVRTPVEFEVPDDSGG